MIFDPWRTRTYEKSPQRNSNIMRSWKIFTVRGPQNVSRIAPKTSRGYSADSDGSNSEARIITL
uniref:Uncharacterized protein n=1 Tax=Candidatus Kentrum sp. SD TaxID=2126332 RepID=A0A450Y523_9GAMM|nr:MAG: hypothetical protein BECKSD772F_GA0070984_100360 [Candidatus Kentron sp. SD]VFK39559.1 MAG: hypothetical protein BECKSD772E_GA0070983_100314 [Candidatus Kentron sp. SD]VFK79334.1 MAG: hypothetical protein BECKSD772D_GA0070982_104517 [Candidatus Kentron sp. SD]